MGALCYLGNHKGVMDLPVRWVGRRALASGCPLPAGLQRTGQSPLGQAVRRALGDLTCTLAATQPLPLLLPCSSRRPSCGRSRAPWAARRGRAWRPSCRWATLQLFVVQRDWHGMLCRALRTAGSIPCPCGQLVAVARFPADLPPLALAGHPRLAAERGVWPQYIRHLSTGMDTGPKRKVRLRTAAPWQGRPLPLTPSLNERPRPVLCYAPTSCGGDAHHQPIVAP